LINEKVVSVENGLKRKNDEIENKQMSQNKPEEMLAKKGLTKSTGALVGEA
jgi:hypothetical protein